MNKNDLIDYVATKCSGEASKTLVAEIIDLAFQGVVEALRGGDEFRMVGFGTFKVTRRDASEGRNPRTGETIQIPATNRVKFTPGKELKDTVNSDKAKKKAA